MYDIRILDDEIINFMKIFTERGYTIYNDDCIKVMHQLITQGVKVDAVICDPPYGKTVLHWDNVIPFDEMWKCLKKLVKPKGNIILFGTGMFAYKLALSNEKLFRYEMVWKKSKCGSPLTAKYMPLKKHENILVFGESASYYEPQMREGKPYKRRFTLSKKNNLGYGIQGVVTDNKGTRHPTTIDPVSPPDCDRAAPQSMRQFLLLQSFGGLHPALPCHSKKRRPTRWNYHTRPQLPKASRLHRLRIFR